MANKFDPSSLSTTKVLFNFEVRHTLWYTWFNEVRYSLNSCDLLADNHSTSWCKCNKNLCSVRNWIYISLWITLCIDRVPFSKTRRWMSILWVKDHSTLSLSTFQYQCVTLVLLTCNKCEYPLLVYNPNKQGPLSLNIFK